MAVLTKFTLIIALALAFTLTLSSHQSSALCSIDKLTFAFESEDSEDEIDLTFAAVDNETNLRPSKPSPLTELFETDLQQQISYWAQAPPANNV